MMRSVAEIDALLDTEKSLFGAPEWVEDGAAAHLVGAVVNAAGVVLGGVSLRLSVLIHLPAPQRGSAVLVLDNHPLQRLSFRPDHAHVNPGRHPVTRGLRRQTLPAERSRIYRWKDNRVWPRPDSFGVGALLASEPQTIGDAFNLFLEECRIAAYLPPPPHRPKLEL
jgi:hypothetical protein